MDEDGRLIVVYYIYCIIIVCMIFVYHYKLLICASNEIFEVLNCHFVAAIFGYNNSVSLESCVALVLLTPTFLNS
jgi:hypothetical protein